MTKAVDRGYLEEIPVAPEFPKGDKTEQVTLTGPNEQISERGWIG